MHSQSRKRPQGQKRGHKGRHGRKPARPESLEQPVSISSSTVPCPICKHPIDPKRMHFHMVRFHGAALRPKSS
jgi:hypothetical protein